MNVNHLPNFFIVGAPKCGTTALSEYLRTHPDIFIARVKELHYFCTDFNESFPRPKTLDQYLRHFEKAKGKTAIGEASPWYLYSKCALKKLYQFNPKAHFIAMVRNPIEMVPSLHRALLNSYAEDQKSLSAAWRLQSIRRNGKNIPPYCLEESMLQYKDVCKLAPQIENFFSVIPAEQRMVIVFDDLKSKTLTTYKQVLSFLNLKYDGRLYFPIINKEFHWRFEGLSKLAQAPSEKINIVEKFFLGLIKRKSIGLHYMLYRFNNKYNRISKPKKSIPADLRREFQTIFSNDVKRLSQLLCRDLTGWLN